jgi:hypothetical protein
MAASVLYLTYTSVTDRRQTCWGERVEAIRNGIDGSENRLVSFLPASDRERLLSKLALVFLNVKTVLFEPGQP